MVPTTVDVIIAGGGAAGITIAGLLANSGYSCMLVEPTAFGAEQSGHSHGYIHQGYVYLSEAELARDLYTSPLGWRSFLTRPRRIRPVTQSSVFAFENPDVARFATQTWRSGGLPVGQLPRFRERLLFRDSPLSAAYVTPEQSFDFYDVLSNLLDRARKCCVVRGRVSRFYTHAGFCSGADVLTPTQSYRVAAKAVVLAAGIGSWSIIGNSIGRSRIHDTTRTSFMLVLSGTDLPQASVILPENRYYGLFMVSRYSGGTRVWLVSNFLSYGGLVSADSRAARLWCRATLSSLAHAFPHAARLWKRAGVYAAPKAELRGDPERLGTGAIDSPYNLPNLFAVWPTKVTLVPRIARKVTASIKSRLGAPSKSRPTSIHRDLIPIAQERWRGTPLIGRSTFMRSLQS
jgi:glycine/D-amino acid oxidase-like deaminating enzyme